MALSILLLLLTVFLFFLKIQNERRKLLVVVMQRVWKVFEEDQLKDVKLYQTMCALLEYLLSRDGIGLAESCLSSAE